MPIKWNVEQSLNEWYVFKPNVGDLFSEIHIY